MISERSDQISTASLSGVDNLGNTDITRQRSRRSEYGAYMSHAQTRRAYGGPVRFVAGWISTASV